MSDGDRRRLVAVLADARGNESTKVTAQEIKNGVPFRQLAHAQVLRPPLERFRAPFETVPQGSADSAFFGVQGVQGCLHNLPGSVSAELSGTRCSSQALNACVARR